MADPIAPGTFIPRDTAVAPVRQSGGEKGALKDLILLVGIVLFVASGALAAGVFLYEQFLTAESQSKVEQLQRAKAAFEPSLIQQLTRLDDRMHAGDRILSAHVAPTAFFHALEQATLQTVAFETLEFDAPDPQHMTIKMAGVAQSVNSIALQADLFSKSGVVVSPIFSNITREADGVHFDLSAVVNPTAVNYGSARGVGAASAASRPSSSLEGTASPFQALQNVPSSSSGPQGDGQSQAEQAPGASQPVEFPAYSN